MGTDYLGKRVRDKITGFTGVVTAQVRHISGCDTVSIQPKSNDRGDKIEDSRQFDVGRLEILPDGEVTPQDVASPDGKTGPSELGEPCRG